MSNVEDELAIRNLVARYADAVNRRSEQDWGATWADEGTWVLPGAGEIKGRTNIVTTWRGAMAGFPFVAQVVYHGIVEPSGTAASGRWTLAEYIRKQDGSGMFNLGIYQDSYVKSAGEWKFLRRQYAVIYNDSTPTAVPGACIPYPNLAG